MEQIALKKILIVASLEIIFLVISFILIGLGFKEMKRKRKRLNSILLVVCGILFGIISLYCSVVLMLY